MINIFLWFMIFLIVISFYVLFRAKYIRRKKADEEHVKLLCQLKIQTPLGFIYYGDLRHQTSRDFLHADCSIRNARTSHEMVAQEIIKEVLIFLNLSEQNPSKVKLDDLDAALKLALMLYRRVKNR